MDPLERRVQAAIVEFGANLEALGLPQDDRLGVLVAAHQLFEALRQAFLASMTEETPPTVH